MTECARMCQDNGARMLDINMGCPAKKVTNGYSGSALMKDLDHAGDLVCLAFADQVGNRTGEHEDFERSHAPLLVDATEEVLPIGFKYRICQPTPRFEYSSHALSPETITGLCRQLYDATPQVHVLAIQGYQWGLREGLSREAHQNMLEALKFFYDQ